MSNRDQCFRLMRGITSGFVATVLFSCAFAADKGPGNMKKAQRNDLATNVVMVNQYGWPVPPTEDAMFNTRAEYLAHFSNVVNHAIYAPGNQNKKILIYFHGGLNTAKARAERARILLSNSSLTNEFVPIFINWSSGLGTTYFEHMKSVRQGRLSNRAWGWITSPLQVVADLGRGIAATPANLVEQTKVDVQAWRWPKAPSHKNAVFVYRELKSPTLSLGCAATSSRLLDEARWVFPGVPGRIVATPLIEAIGQPAWENMLRRTKTMHRKTSEFNLHEYDGTVEESERKHELTTPDALGGVSDFFSVLSRTLSSHPKHSITLIGHSMGAIIAAEVLRTYTNLNFTNIVFMAAACSVRDVETAVIPYLKAHKGSTFYNLSLHPLNEVQEEYFAGFAPRGSLLHFIDHSLSVPEHPTDRTVGSWENVMIAYKVFPPEIRDRVHLKAFNRAPDLRTPVRHGDFDSPEMEFWKDDFWKGRDCNCNDCTGLLK
jgi:hypothetical protein